ncbi:MAG TPA: hypothetical protein VEG37_11270 [Burkholderiales bacterium]|nr:hypothetical protein [Burkholderiales bacterium]
MAVGEKRTMVARVGATLGFLCGVIGLLAGLTQHTWKLGPLGWFTGGTLLTLLAVYALVDGAIAFEKTRLPK